MKRKVLRSETITAVSIEEACRICQVEVEVIQEFVEEGILEVDSQDMEDWRLQPAELAVLKKAARLHRDLGINPPGIALVLELLDALERRQG